MESVEIIQWCIDHLNYATITLLMAIESSFIPFPSEVVIPPAAWKAAHNENLNIYLVVLFATIGADLGAMINYAAAYYLGRPLIYSFARSKWGKMCLLNEEMVERSEKYFADHGVVATLTGRLLPVIRQLISVPAGLAKMNFGKFILYTTIGAGVWNSILAALGWYLHSIVPESQLEAKITEYSDYIKIVIVAAVIVAAAYFAFKKFKKH